MQSRILDFSDYFEKQIKGKLQKLEERRLFFKKLGKDSMQAVVRWAVISTVLSVLLVYMAVGPDFIAMLFTAVFLNILSLVLTTLFYSRKKDGSGYRLFYQEFKEHVIRPVIGFFWPTFDYTPARRLADMNIADSGFFPQFKKLMVDGDDLATGELGGCPLKFSEISLSRLERRGKNNARINVFSGFFFAFELPDSLPGNTFILPRHKKTASLASALSQIKFSRPENMSKDQHMAYNARLLAKATSGFKWEPDSTLSGLQQLPLNGPAASLYEVYSDQPAFAASLVTESILGHFMQEDPDNPTTWTDYNNIMRSVEGPGKNLPLAAREFFLAVRGKMIFLMIPAYGPLLEPNLDTPVNTLDGVLPYYRQLELGFLILGKLIPNR